MQNSLANIILVAYGNFYSDMGTLSEYSCVMLHLYPATRILIVFLSGHDEMCSDDFCISKQFAPSSPPPVMNLDPL